MADWGIFTDRDSRNVNENAGTAAGAGLFTWPRRSRSATMSAAGYFGNGEQIVYWTPWAATAVHPYAKPLPYSLMSSSQASGFTDSIDPDHQPTHGIASYPGGSMQDGVERVRPGRGRTLYNYDQLPQVGPTPNMVFVPPAAHGFQTPPLYAFGQP